MTFGILRTDGILRTGELPHHILHFADRDALGGAPNSKAAIEIFVKAVFSCYEHFAHIHCNKYLLWIPVLTYIVTKNSNAKKKKMISFIL